MNKKYKDWLEEVWDIKENIAKETEGMQFKDYWDYINELSEKGRKEIQAIREHQALKMT